MKYKITIEVTQKELRNHVFSKVIPLYKKDVDEKDIEFMLKNIVDGFPCDAFYDLYTDYFENDYVLSKNKFYKAVREITGLRCAYARIPGVGVKYSFVRNMKKV